MTPDISVVIPAYNVAPYIAEAARSALAQPGVTIEVIAVDDGSTDETGRILDGIAAGDDRLKVIHQENRGFSGARNAGVRAAAGRYVGFLDGDDLWDPGKAAAHVRLMDASPGIDLSFSWYRVVDEQGRATGRRNAPTPSDIHGGLGFEGLVIENFTGSGSAVVVRADAIRAAGLFDERILASCEDLDAWLRVAALRPGNIALIQEELASYRRRDGQATRDWRRMHAGWEATIAKAAHDHPERVLRVERHARSRLSRYLAYVAYENRDYASARMLLARAWLLGPLRHVADRRAWLLTAAVLAEAVLPVPLHERLAGLARARRSGVASA